MKTPTATARIEPRALRVVDLPLPSSSSPQAIEAYRAALQWHRDGDWQAVSSELRRAVALDPNLAPAFLRLAIADRHNRTVLAADIRATYKRAVQLRQQLSSRDRPILRAFEPAILFEPPDFFECGRRLQALCAENPMDAELHGLGALSLLNEPSVMARLA